MRHPARLLAFVLAYASILQIDSLPGLLKSPFCRAPSSSQPPQ